MKKCSYDYMTPQEKKTLEKAIAHREEVEKEIEKLKKMLSQNKNSETF